MVIELSVPSKGCRMSTRAQRAVIAVTGAALFMVVLDNLIVLSALPAIQRALHVSLPTLQWVIDAYILAFAVLVLTGAALGERFGRRRLFTIGVVIFSVASAAGALAPNVGVLTAARAIQGLGGAVLLPLTLTLLSSAFAPEQRGGAIGIWSAIAGLGVALGPIVGGVLTSALSWHWIFWVNVPVGIAVIAATPRVLDESRGAPERIDTAGLALASVGLLGLVGATVQGNTAGWGSAEVLAGYVLGIAGLAAFVAWEARSTHPMLPLRLFAERAFVSSNAAGLLFNFTMFATLLMVVQFLAQVRHQGPVASGLWVLPWTAMPLLVSTPAGRLGRRVSPALLTAIGMGILATGATLIAVLVSPSTPPEELVGGLLLIGAGIGIALPNVSALAIGSVPPADIGRASATLNTARQIGSVFGVAVAVAVFGLAGSTHSAAAISDGVRAAVLVAVAAAVIGALFALRAEPHARLRAAVMRVAASRA